MVLASDNDLETWRFRFELFTSWCADPQQGSGETRYTGTGSQSDDEESCERWRKCCVVNTYFYALDVQWMHARATGGLHSIDGQGSRPLEAPHEGSVTRMVTVYLIGSLGAVGGRGPLCGWMP